MSPHLRCRVVGEDSVNRIISGDLTGAKVIAATLQPRCDQMSPLAAVLGR